MRARVILLGALAVLLVSGAQAGGLSHQPLPKHAPGWDENPDDWSPDGRRIVIGRVYEPLPQEAASRLIELGVVEAEGTNARRLVHQPRSEYEQWDTAADWSPDGTMIAFTRMGYEGSTLYAVDAAGGVARNLTPGQAFGSEWSPDSQLIAFTRDLDREPRNGIWLVRRDGSGETQLTRGADYVPLWSPDGSAIAFTRLVARRGEGLTAIYTIRVDGTGLRQLVGPGDNDALGWSPDSQLILFQRGSDSGNTSAWSMRRDGSGKRKLVRGLSASWSPDGTKLLFGGRNGLYVGDRDGGNARLIFRRARSGIWSPDGSRVAVSVQAPCIGYGVYVVRVAERSARRITNDCRVRGTDGADRLRGTNERDLIYGFAGGDVIDANPGDRKIEYYRRFDDDIVLAGSGDDRVFGRRGGDLLDGGPGRDYLEGGTKSDLIRARDGERDVVVCGRGVRDRVIADRFDSVAADCELVRRS